MATSSLELVEMTQRVQAKFFKAQDQGIEGNLCFIVDGIEMKVKYLDTVN